MFDLGGFAAPLRRSIPGRVRLGGATFQVSSICSDAPGKGQDASLVVDGFAAVADGATPSAGSGADVAKFARDALLALSQGAGRPAQEMYRNAVEELSRGRVSGAEMPSCTIALARSRDSDVELSSVCDSFAVARLRDGSYVVVQDNGPPYDHQMNQEMGEKLARGVPFPEAKASFMRRLKLERGRWMNRPGGYWVVADNPEVGKHAVTKSIPAQEIDCILLASDGFGRLFELFDEVDSPQELLEWVLRDGLPAVHRRLRHLENKPGSLNRYPRLSLQDDATAILLRAN